MRHAAEQIGLLLALLSVVGCSDSDDGTSGPPADTSPTAPATYTYNPELVTHPNVPERFQMVMAQTTSAMQQGANFLGFASGQGTAVGAGCWEWTETMEDYDITLEACEATEGGVTWSAAVSEWGGDPLLLLSGTVAGDGLSGTWSYVDPPGGELAMTESWSTDGQGSWVLDLAVYDTEVIAGLAPVRQVDPLYRFHYEEEAGGAGSCCETVSGEVVWSMTWVLEGEDLTGEYCEYEEGIPTCYDLGGVLPEDLPPAPGGLFFEDGFGGSERVPEELAGILSDIENLATVAEDFFGSVAQAGTFVDGCWIWESDDGQGNPLTIDICEEADAACWSVTYLDCTGLGPEVVLEGCESTAIFGGWIKQYGCIGGEPGLVHHVWWWVDDSPVFGTEHVIFWTLAGSLDYEEHPDGSGHCEWTLPLGQDPSWWCEWDTAYHGEFCRQVVGGEPDCETF